MRGKEADKDLIQDKNYSKSFTGSVYRTYSYLNLLDLEHIKQQLSKEEDFFIDEGTILSTYEGHTIFSIFLHKIEVYEQIYSQFQDLEFEDELNSLKKFAENGILRRLYRIISMPTADIEIDASKTKNNDVNCKVCMNRKEEATAPLLKKSTK